MAKSFWERSDDYAKKVSGEIIDQIKRGVASWQKPWKPGEQSSPKISQPAKSTPEATAST